MTRSPHSSILYRADKKQLMRLIAFGVKWSLKNPNSAVAFLLHRCSKEATPIPFPPMSVKFTYQKFSH